MRIFYLSDADSSLAKYVIFLSPGKDFLVNPFGMEAPALFLITYICNVLLEVEYVCHGFITYCLYICK